MEFTTPGEYHRHETLYGPPVRLSVTSRLSIPVDQQLREFAAENRTDISVCVRHALHEYLTNRGVKPFAPLGT